MYGSGMNREAVDIIIHFLYGLLVESMVGAEDHCKLCAAVKFNRPELGAVDLIQRSEVKGDGGIAVEFRALEDDARWRRVGKLGGAAYEWVQEIDCVEVTKPVNAEVAIDIIWSTPYILC